MDFLPATLFPDDRIRITKWGCAGISLGGHSVWLAGSHDDRLSVLIPIIGAPSLLDLLAHRAKQNKLELSPPLFPASLHPVVKKHDAVHQPLDVFQGKRILALCGSTDQLVPWKEGGTAMFISKLQEAGVEAQLVVSDGVGHTCTPGMLEQAGDFLAEGFAS
jgi:hypothetical protein